MKRRGSKARCNIVVLFDDQAQAEYVHELRSCPLRSVEFTISVYSLTGRQPYGVKVEQLRDYLRTFGNVGIYDAGFRLPFYGVNIFLNRDYSRMAGSVVKDAQLNRLPVAGVGSIQGYCVPLPKRKVDNIHWFPLLWICEHDTGEHQLQVVVTGHGGGNECRPFGFRWDPPEGQALGDGSHDFWHVQPITSVRTVPPAVIALGIPEGDICVQVPTFAIDASNQLQMLDALCISLYGPDWPIQFGIEFDLRKALDQESSTRGWAKCRPGISGSTSKAAGGVAGGKKGKK